MNDLGKAEDGVGIGVVETVHENEHLALCTAICADPLEKLSFRGDLFGIDHREFLLGNRRHMPRHWTSPILRFRSGGIETTTLLSEIDVPSGVTDRTRDAASCTFGE